MEITTDLHATRRHAPKHKTATRGTREARGARYTLTHPHEVADWTETTLTRAGLTLHRDGMQISNPLRLTGRKAGEKPSPITVDTCRVTATATVTDPNAFTEALHTGIGRSRAYGAGLIRHRTLT